MTGTRIQPTICPAHHQTGFLEKANMKFSIPRENSIVL